jgi:TIR domain
LQAQPGACGQLALVGPRSSLWRRSGGQIATTNFFISYTGKDAGWAEWIGWQLEDAGYTVTVQAWDSRPGNDFVVWMDQAVRDADRILVVLSPDYEQALSFTVPEWPAAFGRDPTGRLGVLLPVRVADFLPGGLFRTRGWVDLAGRLELPEAGAAEQEVVLGAVRRWLTGNGGWLLVFDNAEPTASVIGSFPEGDGALLVTSRDPAWRRQTTVLLPVETLDRAESVRLLRRRTGDDDKAAADQLAEALGDLAVALEQAAAYGEAEQLPLASYLGLFHADAADLLAEGQPTDYTDTVATTGALAMAKAGTRSAAAPDLLRLFAFLGPDKAPWTCCSLGSPRSRSAPVPWAGWTPPSWSGAWARSPATRWSSAPART